MTATTTYVPYPARLTGELDPNLSRWLDLTIGINRWIYRVTTYVALMRDEYPPFQLDQGPHEPVDAHTDPLAGTPGLLPNPA